MSFSKSCVGIDISKATFSVCVCHRLGDDLHFSEIRVFKNQKTGFNQLLRWVRKQNQAQGDELVFLMEATGVYHQRLAHHLCHINQVVHVVLPNKSKHFFGSLNVKSKTDALDAKVLSQFGVERKHRVWSPPDPVMAELRSYTRFCLQLQHQKTCINNIKHSNDHSYGVPAVIVRENKKLIQSIDRQIDRCKQEVQSVVNSRPQLKERVDKLCTIKGVGLMTVVTILAETNGFEFITNVKQLVSYAGYDVIAQESGTSVKGKARISKKGNSQIRNALHFPALVAARYNPQMKKFYTRISQKKSARMIAAVAVQRKLLILIYSLWKSGQTYDPKKDAAKNKKLMAALDQSESDRLLLN